MKMKLTAIPPMALFALTLTISVSSRATAGEPDDLGSFDDILVALEPETMTLEGPLLNGPLVVDSTSATPIQSSGLILDGPVPAPQTSTRQVEMLSAMAPGQIRNPFLDFKTVVEAPQPKQVDETQYVLPAPSLGLEVTPSITTQPRIDAPVPSIETSPRNVAPSPNRDFVYPQKPAQRTLPRIATSTIVKETIEPECPYERALRIRRLSLEAPTGDSITGFKTGYVPYGGRGLDRNSGCHRSEVYRVRTTAGYIPVYSGMHGSSFLPPRTSHCRGRGLLIGYRW